MFTPQQLADAIDEARCSGTMEAVGALLSATHPEHAALLRDMPFGGELSEPQKHIRVRADVLLMRVELRERRADVLQACVELLHYAGRVTEQAKRIVRGNLSREINDAARGHMEFMCADPARKAKQLRILRAALSKISDKESDFSDVANAADPF